MVKKQKKGQLMICKVSETLEFQILLREFHFWLEKNNF